MREVHHIRLPGEEEFREVVDLEARKGIADLDRDKAGKDEIPAPYDDSKVRSDIQTLKSAVSHMPTGGSDIIQDPNDPHGGLIVSGGGTGDGEGLTFYDDTVIRELIRRNAEAIESKANEATVRTWLDDKQDFIADLESMRAGAAISSNPNIIDNGWFTVNQRGQTLYTAQGYTVDRWKKMNITSLSQTSNGVRLTRTEESSSYYIEQPIERPAQYDKENLTLSALLLDGTIVTVSGRCTLGASGYTLYTVDNQHHIAIGLYAPANNTLSVRVFVQSINADVDLRAVKLEYGLVSTLKSDHAPDYAVELLKCQRYFQLYPFLTSDIVATLQAYSASNAMGTFRFVTPMRTAPSATALGSFRVFNGSTAVHLDTLNINTGGVYSVRLFAPNVAYTIGQAVTLQSTSNDTALQFTADL